MNRRSFLAGLVGGVAASGAVVASVARVDENVGRPTFLGGATGDPQLDWEFAAEPARTAEGSFVFVYGTMQNTGDGSAGVVEFDVLLYDDAGQRIASRTIELTDINAQSEQRYWYRIPVGTGTVRDGVADAEFNATVVK